MNEKILIPRIAKSFIPKKVYGQGESYDNEVYTQIQTILNKYKQYL